MGEAVGSVVGDIVSFRVVGLDDVGDTVRDELGVQVGGRDTLG